MGKQSKRKQARHDAPPEPRSAAVSPVAADFRRDLAVIAALIAAVAVVYAQVRSHAFINYDDSAYIVRNAHVLGGLSWANMKWAFTATEAGYWHPLTWLSHLLDVTLFGRDAGAHLLMNVSLHALTAAVLYAWLRMARLPWTRSTAVAALFALHPLRVESVAWAAERKDVLSAFFFVLTLIAWTRFAQTRSRRWYSASLAALLLGLLAKPMLVTAPFVLLLIDEWPLRRAEGWRRRFLEKIPHFAAVAVFAVITLRTQSAAITSTNAVPLLVRAGNAFQSYLRYLGKTVWPSKLALLYPYGEVSPFWAIGAFVAFVAITVAAVRLRARAPWLTVGWLWYAGTLVPVIGFVQAGQQSMADRFTYIPHIGLFLAVVWGIADLASRQRNLQLALSYVAAAAIIACAATTYAQLGYWKNSRTIWTRTLEVTPSPNRLAHLNLGEAFLGEGDFPAAEREYRAAAGQQPADVVYLGLALALEGEGKLDNAAQAARRAVEVNPNNADALDALGSIELARGNTAEAIRILGMTASRKNDPAVLARLALARNDLAEARRRFAEAERLHPEDASLHNSYAAVLAREGNDQLAAEQYEAAIRTGPGLYDARMNYAALLSRMGREAEALRELDMAARLRPQSPEPLVYQALVEANGRRFSDAVAHLQRAVSIDHGAANRYLTEAIRIAPKKSNVDEYLAYLRAQPNGG